MDYGGFDGVFTRLFNLLIPHVFSVKNFPCKDPSGPSGVNNARWCY